MSTLKSKIGLTLSLIVCAVLALVALSHSGMAAASAPAKPMAISANAPTVNPDRTVTFSLRAPGANSVYLNFQNMRGNSPAYNSYPMTVDANGVWSITLGPTVPGLMGWNNPPAPLDPNWYGYGFNVDGQSPVIPPPNPNTTAVAVGGLNISDPENLDTSFFQAGPLWTASQSSVWSYVMVPGPGTEYMADALIPHGAVSNVRYYSDVHQRNMEMLVYTPPGYNHDNRRYPVLYLYHGGGGLKTDWFVNMRANYILDNLIAQGMVTPMIIVMPEYMVRGCSNFSGDPFSHELLGNIIPAIEQNFRVAPGGKNRALAGLSSGGGCVMNALFWNPGEFAYIGAFSANWTASARNDLVQNHPDLLTNPAINKNIKLLWISRGALEGTQNFLPLLDEYHINYTWVPGSEVGANYGHVWDTWRHHLLEFAPLLFK